MPPRRRVWFFLGGVVSSSILRGDSETECLLEELDERLTSALMLALLLRDPVMHHGACMVNLIKLLPSKHVSMLSTPLISKIKNKFRAMGELKHKFRKVFKALKTRCKSKIFSDYIYIGLTGIVCLHLLRANSSQLDHGGIGLGSNFG
jgi:hypothetical protein